MNSQQSKTKLEPIEMKPIKTPTQVWTLEQHEAFDPFKMGRIDGLLINKLNNTTVVVDGHMVAFYKWKKILIPFRYG